MPNLDLFLQYTIHWPTISTSEIATLVLMMLFVLLLMLEAHYPSIKSSQKLRNQSYKTNISLFLLNSTLLSLLSASSLYVLADRYAGTGLLSYVSAPLLKAVLAFLILDLMLYFWHRASHHFDYLWMFHRVHHSDPQMNVSTAFRVHILELIITTLLKAAYIITLGVDKIVVLTEEALMTFFIMFHHTNISFPVENLLRRVFIVPYLHRVHHSVIRLEHDQNYGAVLSIWDRMLGTLAELEPVAIGINNNPAQDVLSQVVLGFTPVVTPAKTLLQPSVSLQAMVAEAAYYKAQNRGFLPGNDLADWLEAEQEIQKLLNNQNLARNRKKNQIALNGCLTTVNC